MTKKLEEIELSKEDLELEQLREKAEKLKTQHKTKKVFLISVEDEDTGEWKSAFFRKPKLKEFSMFTTLAQKDKIQALQTLMKNIYLEGDNDLISDDDLFLAAMTQIEEIVNVQASKIKKF